MVLARIVALAKKYLIGQINRTFGLDPGSVGALGLRNISFLSALTSGCTGISSVSNGTCSWCTTKYPSVEILGTEVLLRNTEILRTSLKAMTSLSFFLESFAQHLLRKRHTAPRKTTADTIKVNETKFVTTSCEAAVFELVSSTRMFNLAMLCFGLVSVHFDLKSNKNALK